jgi:hypothetical protein
MSDDDYDRMREYERAQDFLSHFVASLSAIKYYHTEGMPDYLKDDLDDMQTFFVVMERSIDPNDAYQINGYADYVREARTRRPPRD